MTLGIVIFVATAAGAVGIALALWALGKRMRAYSTERMFGDAEQHREADRG